MAGKIALDYLITQLSFRIRTKVKIRGRQILRGSEEAAFKHIVQAFREVIMLALYFLRVCYPSKIATARTQPELALVIFTGNTDTLKP